MGLFSYLRAAVREFRGSGIFRNKWGYEKNKHFPKFNGKIVGILLLGLAR